MAIFSIIIALLFSALFSGMEIAFISANKLKVEIKKIKGSKAGEIISNFYEKPSGFLSTMLVGNNIALVIFSLLLEQQIEAPVLNLLGVEGGLLAVLVMSLLTTIIVLIFGEFLPKVLFRLFADRIVLSMAHIILALQYLLMPISWVMVNASRWLIQIFTKVPKDTNEFGFTRLDLEKFVYSTQSSTEAEKTINTELFENVLYLEKVKVGDAMIPRTEIVAIGLDADVSELKDLFIQTGLSKILIFDENIDEVLGYIHHHQLLKAPSEIKDIIIDIPIVPETMRVRDAMNRFIKDRNSIACVVDEFGGTAGIITLEDILEEIFGEIKDEYDQEEYIEQVLENGDFVFAGRLEIDYLNEKYNLDLPVGDDYTTLSGYLVMTKGEIPEQTDSEITLGEYRFILEKVSEKKVEIVRLVPLSSESK